MVDDIPPMRPWVFSRQAVDDYVQSGTVIGLGTGGPGPENERRNRP